MTKRRAFKPPPTCSRCGDRPFLGEILFNTGAVWICAGCLTDDSNGSDTTTKMVGRALRSEQSLAHARRAANAGDGGEAAQLEMKALWHRQAAIAVKQSGNRLAKDVDIINGEAVPTERGYLRDTLSDPDLAAIESSEARGRLLEQNDVVALGVDIANTVRASNTAEKLIAHQIAVAHKVAMEQARRSQAERDPVMELKRLQISAKMMGQVREGILALQRLKATGPQSVTVQHVHVNAGGQAVVGNVQTGLNGANREA